MLTDWQVGPPRVVASWSSWNVACNSSSILFDVEVYLNTEYWIPFYCHQVYFLQCNLERKCSGVWNDFLHKLLAAWSSEYGVSILVVSADSGIPVTTKLRCSREDSPDAAGLGSHSLWCFPGGDAATGAPAGSGLGLGGGGSLPACSCSSSQSIMESVFGCIQPANPFFPFLSF